MIDKEAIKIKGNQNGLNIIINLLEFKSMNSLIDSLLEKLIPLKNFYSGNVVYITTYPLSLDDEKKHQLEKPLKEKINLVDIIFNDTVKEKFVEDEISRLKKIEDEKLIEKKLKHEKLKKKKENENKVRKEKSEMFLGIDEGNTKFIKKTLRGGQVVDYPGNVVIIGDVHMGAEIFAEGNIIVLGELKGRAFAGVSGNKEAIVAALRLNPSLLSISKSLARPVDSKIEFPEIATLKDGNIYVEPYVAVKYEY